jgi:CheY-like chemotaxis protein
MERLGLNCISDTSSQQVLDLARQHRPAVIVLDIHQLIDGRDLLLQLKKDPQTADCKVLILSAVEDQFTRQTCLALGAEDYDVKPFDTCFVHKVARLAGVDPRAPLAD